MNLDEFTPNFLLGDVSDKTAEFSPNFALGDVSPETAEFCSQGCFRRNRRINPAEFRTGDDSDETAEFPPNFALGAVSLETAESIPPNFVLETFPPKWPKQSRRISHSGTFPTKRPNFRRIAPSRTFPTR
ncbi:MAG: hypothetical protein Q8881_02750 [Sweet potato little leaf phytoplasma]|nr:hypothetical protein [Sweet potato little leaf phytoplasma]